MGEGKAECMVDVCVHVVRDREGGREWRRQGGQGGRVDGSADGGRWRSRSAHGAVWHLAFGLQWDSGGCGYILPSSPIIARRH